MLDYKKMLKEICKLVETDFCQNMECKLLPDSRKYTQKEAEEMAEILGNVYAIAHCLHCKACGVNYKINYEKYLERKIRRLK